MSKLHLALLQGVKRRTSSRKPLFEIMSLHTRAEHRQISKEQKRGAYRVPPSTAIYSHHIVDDGLHRQKKKRCAANNTESIVNTTIDAEVNAVRSTLSGSVVIYNVVTSFILSFQEKRTRRPDAYVPLRLTKPYFVCKNFAAEYTTH